MCRELMCHFNVNVLNREWKVQVVGRGEPLPQPACLVGFVFFFFLFRATLTAYGGSQAKGRIRAVATGLRHSHSNVGSELVPATYTTAHSKAGSLTH